MPPSPHCQRLRSRRLPPHRLLDPGSTRLWQLLAVRSCAFSACRARLPPLPRWLASTSSTTCAPAWGCQPSHRSLLRCSQPHRRRCCRRRRRRSSSSLRLHPRQCHHRHPATRHRRRHNRSCQSRAAAASRAAATPAPPTLVANKPRHRRRLSCHLRLRPPRPPRASRRNPIGGASASTCRTASPQPPRHARRRPRFGRDADARLQAAV